MRVRTRYIITGKRTLLQMGVADLAGGSQQVLHLPWLHRRLRHDDATATESHRMPCPAPTRLVGIQKPLNNKRSCLEMPPPGGPTREDDEHTLDYDAGVGVADGA